MEKDVDEVGKIARGVKGKLEALNRDVIIYSSYFGSPPGFSMHIVTGL